jgi:hypothetical protein
LYAYMNNKEKKSMLQNLKIFTLWFVFLETYLRNPLLEISTLP